MFGISYALYCVDGLPLMRVWIEMISIRIPFPFRVRDMIGGQVIYKHNFIEDSMRVFVLL